MVESSKGDLPKGLFFCFQLLVQNQIFRNVFYVKYLEYGYLWCTNRTDGQTIDEIISGNTGAGEDSKTVWE